MQNSDIIYHEVEDVMQSSAIIYHIESGYSEITLIVT